MQKKFITNLFLIIFLNLLIKPFWIFGIDRTVQNVVGAESYGFYFSLLGFSFLLNILLDFGITNYNNRNISQNQQLLTKHLSSIIILRFILAIVYFAVCLIAGLIIGYNLDQLKLLVILLLNQFLASFILYLRSNLEALQLFKIDSLISVLDRVLMIVICSILLWGNVTQQTFRIEWFVYAQTFAYGFTALFALLMVLRKAELLKLNWNFPFFVMILKQSFPFALLALLMGFYYRIDTVMLERILPDGDKQSGIYAQSFRLLETFNIIPYLFAVLLLPMFSKMIKQKESINALVKLSFSLAIVPAIVISIGISLYKVEFIDLLFKHNTEASSKILGVIIFSFIGVSTSYIFGTLLTANGNLKQLNIVAGSVMVLNIILNLILIPEFFAFGSAIAGLITQSISAIIQLCLVVYLFKFRFNYKLLFRLILFTTGTLIFGIISKHIFPQWIFNLLFMFVCSIIWAFITRLISIKSLYSIIKY